MTIFTMSLSLRFVQGFTDDPALLASALGRGDKSPDETHVEKTVLAMLDQQTVQSALSIAPMQHFFQENDNSRTVDRAMITLANLQRLETSLNTFPGRKNVVWFTQGVRWIISGDVISSGILNQQLDEELNKTMNMLASARIALYPVDARSVSTTGFYQADNVLTVRHSPCRKRRLATT